MKNIKKDLIITAFDNMSENTYNKFFGLISILQSLETEDFVKAGKTYKIDTEKLSQTLERLFYFGTSTRTFTQSNYYITFSSTCFEKVLGIFFKKKPSIEDVAIYFQIKKEFDEDLSLSSIISDFKSSLHLSDVDMKEIFDIAYEDKSNIMEDKYPKNLVFDEIIKKKRGIVNNTLTFEAPFSVASHPAEFSRAPFIQSLYAAQSTLECLLLTKFDLNKIYTLSESPKNDLLTLKTEHTLQKVFYGAPGTGKSHKVKEITKDENKTIVTFHPDTDYTNFVGGYKPQMGDDGKAIIYGFVPQAFAKAYVNAWKDPSKPYFLIIEEINRGNCAQIFGDVFQLLDRDSEGYSEYVIDVDKDFADYIKQELSDVDGYQEKVKELGKIEDEAEFSFTKIALPSNLHIWATMNTSDQSLFPMDSAFKRRWDWEYMPIDYVKASEVKIDIEGAQYSWGNFIQTVNQKIKDITLSEDKQLGTFFVKAPTGIISFDQFRSKVMFYLWFEIYKDEMGTSECIFRRSKDDTKGFTFGDLFTPNGVETIKNFMAFLEIEPNPSEAEANQDTEVAITD